MEVRRKIRGRLARRRSSAEQARAIRMGVPRRERPLNPPPSPPDRD